MSKFIRKKGIIKGNYLTELHELLKLLNMAETVQVLGAAGGALAPKICCCRPLQNAKFGGRRALSLGTQCGLSVTVYI